MSSSLITCPHCGFSKEVPAGAIPKGTVKVNCPKCRQGFPLAGNVREAAASAPEPPPIETARPEPPATPEPPLRPSAPRPYSVDISEIESALEAEEETPEAEEVPETPAPAAAGPKPSEAAKAPPRPAPKPKPKGTGAGLSGIGELFGAAWEVYKARAVTLLVLTLLMGVFSLVGLGLGAGGAALLASVSIPAAGASAFAGVVLGLAGMFWGFSALITAIVDEGLGIKDALGMGRHRLWPMLWVTALTAFMVIGGYLFLLIPGIVFSVWFFAAVFVLVDQGGRGVSALLASRDYVRGHGWGVFGRLFLVSLLSSVLGMVPLAGPILSFLFWPFTLIFGYLVYADLKASRGEAEFTYTTGEKAKLLGTGAFGYVLIPLLIAAFVFSSAMKLGISASDFLLQQGIALPSLGGSISGLTGGLFEKDQDVRQAYSEYREALMSGDVEALKGHIAKDKAKDIEGPAAAVALELAKALAPANATITDSSVDGDKATLTLQSEVEGGTIKGTAEMVREDGEWKLDAESWEMNLSPPGITLKGGKGAPEFEPLGREYLSAPAMFGMATGQPFSRGKQDPPKELVQLAGHEDAVTNVAFTPTGQLVSASYGDYTVRLWDVSSGAEITSYKMENRPTGMAVTPDGDAVILADAYQNLTFLPLLFNSFGEAAVVPGGFGNNSQLAISPNGRLLATASFDKMVTIWDVQTKTKLRTIETPEPMRAVAFSPGGEILAAGDSTNKFTLWDLGKGEGRTYSVPKVAGTSDVGSIDISPDSGYLATGHMDSSITIWDLKTQKELHNFYVSNASTWDVLFSPDGGVLATGQQNGEVDLWKPATAATMGRLKGHSGGARCLAFNQAGTLLASGGEDKTIRVWGYDLSAAQPTDQASGAAQGGMTMTTTPEAERPPSPDNVSVNIGPNRIGPGAKGPQLSVYVYSINYKGMVRLNGREFYEIKGEKDMNYNYSGGGWELQYGRNVFDLDYQALPGDPWMTEARIKVYEYDFDTSKENVLAEWKVNDKGGKRQFVLELKE